MKETKFKNTDIGLIPQDWTVAKLSENGHLQKNTAQILPDKKYVEYSMPAFDNGKKPEIKTGKEMQSARFKISAPILLFNKLNVRQRRIWYLDKAEDNAICSMEFLPYESDSIYLPYLRLVLDTNKVTNDFIGLSKGTSNSQKRIAPKDFAEYSISLPPTLTEQTRIATALSDIDSLIDSLGKLIQKKRNIKQGAMQELLTGKKRLKGFEKPWVEKMIGEIGYTYNGLTGKSSNDFGVGNSKYITFLNVLNNVILRVDQFEKVDVKPSENQNKAKFGDLFFNTSSETPEEVGICAVLQNDLDNLYLNSFCFGFRLTDKTNDGLFLSYLFRSKSGRDIMTALAQGSTRYNLSKDQFLKTAILLPSTLEEQTAIARILSDMDKEIEALEAKQEKYKSIKEGMMQELLSGRIRLV